MNKRLCVFLAAVLCGVLLALGGDFKAHAHTGTPSMVTWSNGSTLTSTDLNNALAHLHNTFSGGIVDSHINTAAAIAHSKLATPSLVPKAWATVTADCNGSTAAGTATCTATTSQVTSVVSSGTNGQFCVTLGYAPTDTAFNVQVTSHTTTVNCIADTRVSHGTSCGTGTRDFYVKCFDYAGAASVASAQFSFVVLDDN